MIWHEYLLLGSAQNPFMLSAGPENMFTLWHACLHLFASLTVQVMVPTSFVEGQYYYVCRPMRSLGVHIHQTVSVQDSRVQCCDDLFASLTAQVMVPTSFVEDQYY